MIGIPRVAHRTWVALPILGLAVGRLAAGAEEPITYTKHVAPILFKNCASCHRPGQVAPFSLLTYRDAAKRAGFIKEVTASRRMPVWKPAPGFEPFRDALVLTKAETLTLARWADTGATEGDPKDLPPAPTFADGWKLGTPDLVLRMPEPFTVPADGGDVFRAFVLPIGNGEDRTVAGVEFRPGNPRVVHHARFFLDNTGAARLKDEQDPGPGYSVPDGTPGIQNYGTLGGWVPGATPRLFPPNVGHLVRKNSDLGLLIHYHPSGKVETDRSSLGVYFTRPSGGEFLFIKPPLARNIAVEIRMVYPHLNIPPGEKRHRVVSTRYTLPRDLRVVSIDPHMHLVGREMKVTAHLPGGKERTLIWIKDWDFDWQGYYPYTDPVPLPRGTVLEMEAFFDNSDGNPRNPNKPPKWVRRGLFTTDEMCECMMAVIAERPAEWKLLEYDMKQMMREAAERYYPESR